jgi:hypothetical protein
MSKWSVGLMPEPSGCRVLVLEDGKRAVLRAVLPGEPKKPQALRMLCEALALWSGRKVSAAVCADGEQFFSDQTSWSDATAVEGGSLFEMKVVVGHEPANEDLDSEMGAFDAVRAFVCRWVES